MSGHSKWSQIKRKKGIKDQQKGLIFSKLAKVITLSVVEGGGITDPVKNVRLRLAIDHARAENMPKENIARAIEKSKRSEREGLVEVVYEAFAPGGVSLIIVVATVNANRSHSEIRNLVEKRGGKMGSSGATSYLFEKCGLVLLSKEDSQEEVIKFGELVGATDIEEDEVNYKIYIPFMNLGNVKNAQIFYKPRSYVVVSPLEKEKIDNFISELVKMEDVVHIYSNLKI